MLKNSKKYFVLKKKWTEEWKKEVVDIFLFGSAIKGKDNPNDIDISITKDMVVIKGHRLPTEKVDPSDYYHRELYWGSFSRSIILPFDIDNIELRA